MLLFLVLDHGCKPKRTNEEIRLKAKVDELSLLKHEQNEAENKKFGRLSSADKRPRFDVVSLDSPSPTQTTEQQTPYVGSQSTTTRQDTFSQASAKPPKKHESELPERVPVVRNLNETFSQMPQDPKHPPEGN